MITRISQPCDIRLGGGAVRQLPDVIKSCGAQRPLLVTDRHFATTEVVGELIDLLREASLEPRLHDGAIPDPTSDSLAEGLALLRQHRADCVVGLGGGSSIDTAKALALLARTDVSLRSVKAPFVNKGGALPIIAIPTTAGSGSEATQFTVITDSATNEKMLCVGPAFLPTGAVVDFELTMSMPPRLTADTGVDALCHALEAYVSSKANTFANGMSIAAIASIGTYLRRVYWDGQDREGREMMMSASMQAGIAFSNSSVALIHGMSRPIGAHFGIPHGLSNAMLIRVVTDYSLSGAEARYAQCARAYGCADAFDSDDIASRKLVDELGQLCEDLDVPTPHELGIDVRDWEELLPTMSQQALDSGSPGNNPRIPTRQEIEDLYRAVYK